jgi:hypothetical protein
MHQQQQNYERRETGRRRTQLPEIIAADGSRIFIPPRTCFPFPPDVTNKNGKNSENDNKGRYPWARVGVNDEQGAALREIHWRGMQHAIAAAPSGPAVVVEGKESGPCQKHI